jgi:hypothetical protein
LMKRDFPFTGSTKENWRLKIESRAFIWLQVLPFWSLTEIAYAGNDRNSRHQYHGSDGLAFWNWRPSNESVNLAV